MVSVLGALVGLGDEVVATALGRDFAGIAAPVVLQNHATGPAGGGDGDVGQRLHRKILDRTRRTYARASHEKPGSVPSARRIDARVDHERHGCAR